MAGTIVVDRIESDASYASTINVAGQITFSNTVNFGVFAGTAPVAGFYLPTTNNLAFTTASTERMRIDSAGNVGIGTATPSAPLDVKVGTGNFTVGLSGAGNTQLTSAGALRLDSTSGTTLFQTGGTERMRIDSSGNVLIGGTSTTTHPALNKFVSLQSQTNNDVVGYGLYVNEGINSRRGSLFLDDSTGLFGLDVSAGSGVPNIVFRTAGTEHVRITSGDGNLLVGTTSAVGKLTVSDANNRSESTSQFSITGAGYAGYHFLDGTAYYIGQNSNGRELRIYSGSSTAVGVRLTAGNNAWQTYSDERMKDIIEPIENAAQKVSTLRTVIGKYKTDAIDKRRVFMIAQDVQAVLPEAVTTDAEGMLGMAYDHIVPLLTAAIKEQQALIQALTTRITALESN